MRKAKRLLKEILIGSALGVASAMIFILSILLYCLKVGPLI